jgi:hypothetical protein
MPYILPRRRKAILEQNGAAESAGELNFRICSLINSYLLYKGLDYQNINDVVGALDGAKSEFQRRVVVPYENSKIVSNGDVFDPSLITKGIV